jgi:hypothetical protein
MESSTRGNIWAIADSIRNHDKKLHSLGHAQTLLGIDAVEHGSVLQHVGENHEAHVAAPQVTARKHKKARRQVNMKQ